MEKGEFLKKLETELKISKNSRHTIRNYLGANNSLLNYLKKEPEQIDEDDIKLFMAENLTTKSSMSTILFLSAIRYSFLNIFQKDPTRNIKRPKREKKIPIVLSKQAVSHLLSSIPNKKSKLMISLMYACGFRVSELVNLKVNDLDFDEKTGHVRAGKGKKDRIFNIPEFLYKDLQKQIKKQKQHQQEYLFTNPSTGKNLSTRNIQKIVQKAAAIAGLKKQVHPHTLRHSFATHLLENGTDIRIIQELLGHANLNTTEQYTHLSMEQIKKVKSPLDTLG